MPFQPNADAYAIFYACKARGDFSETAIRDEMNKLFAKLEYPPLEDEEKIAVVVAWVQQESKA